MQIEIQEWKGQKPGNRENQRTKQTWSTYLLCFTLTLFHDLYYFLKKSIAIGRGLYLRTCTFTWGTTQEYVSLCHEIYILQPRTCPYAVSTWCSNFFTFLQFANPCCLLYQTQGFLTELSHIFWRILMHFWYTFPFFTVYWFSKNQPKFDVKSCKLVTLLRW